MNQHSTCTYWILSKISRLQPRSWSCHTHDSSFFTLLNPWASRRKSSSDSKWSSDQITVKTFLCKERLLMHWWSKCANKHKKVCDTSHSNNALIIYIWEWLGMSITRLLKEQTMVFFIKFPQKVPLMRFEFAKMISRINS